MTNEEGCEEDARLGVFDELDLRPVWALGKRVVESIHNG